MPPKPARTTNDLREGLRRLREKHGVAGISAFVGKSVSTVRSWSKTDRPSDPSVSDLIQLGIHDAAITGSDVADSALWWLRQAGERQESDAVLRNWVDLAISSNPATGLITQLVAEIGAVAKSGHLSDASLAWAGACRMTQYAHEKERDEWLKKPGGVVVCIWNTDTSKKLSDQGVQKELSRLIKSSSERQLLIYASIDRDVATQAALAKGLEQLRGEFTQPEIVKVYFRQSKVRDEHIGDIWVYIGEASIAYAVIPQRSLVRFIDSKRWAQSIKDSGRSGGSAGLDMIGEWWKWSHLSVKLDENQAKSYFESRGFRVGEGLTSIEPDPTLQNDWKDLDGTR